jgi:CRISPR-associated endonuclease/helicase Cas3
MSMAVGYRFAVLPKSSSELEHKYLFMSDPAVYSAYWGKKDASTGIYHLLPYHCLDVAAAGTYFIEHDPRLSSIFLSHPLFRDNRGLLPFLLALHDLGKFSQPFQDKIQRDVGSAGHTAEAWEYLSLSLKKGDLKAYFAEKTSEVKELEKHLSILFPSIAGHHGTPPKSIDIYKSCLRDFGTENRAAADAFIREIAELFLPAPVIGTPDRKETKKLSWLLAGICVVADWIASNPDYYRWEMRSVPLSEYWARTYQCSAEILPQTGLLPSPVSEGTTAAELFGFSPRPLQAAVEMIPVSSGPNLYILEESTGGGKTEAALILVKKLMMAGCGNGLYFALPTMATANAMYDRIAGDAKVYEKFYTGLLPVSVVLAHGKTLLSERYQDFIEKFGSVSSADNWMYDTNKKALLSSIGVGTIDQVLMAVLPLRHQSLRILGSVRNVLVIDEVHSYDTYMNNLLEKLLRFHKSCGGSAILLSATLSKEERERFVSIYSSTPDVPDSSPYPLITCVNGNGEISEIAVPPSPEKYVAVQLIHTELDIVSELQKTAEMGGCACWIRNTVSDAISAYRMLKNLPNVDVSLFHARFTMGDRLDHENTVLHMFGKSSTPEMRRGKILVATQVVEQSLDLDFDCMISDLAPIDLLIQRAGRLWRHVRCRPEGFVKPEFWVYSPDPQDVKDSDWYSSVFPGGSFVYPEHGKLWRAADLLKKQGGFSMPKDARFLIDTVYSADETDIPKVLVQRDFDAREKTKLSYAHADRISLNLQHGYSSELETKWFSDEPALTREGELTVAVELWKEDGHGREIWRSADVHKELLSRVTVRQIVAKRCFGTADDDGVVRLRLKCSGDIWVPFTPLVDGVSYSMEEGLVYPR